MIELLVDFNFDDSTSNAAPEKIMDLGHLVAGEVGVDPQCVLLLRHSNKKTAALRQADCDIVHDYTLVQPTNSKYDFYAADKLPIQVVVVIVDDAVYAVYRITGVKRTGTTRSLTSPAYNRFDIEQGYEERYAKEFSAEQFQSKVLKRKVIGWTSPRNAVARYGGRLFDSVTVSTQASEQAPT